MCRAVGVLVCCCGAPGPVAAAAAAAALAVAVTAAEVQRGLRSVAASQELLRVSLELFVLLVAAKEEERNKKEQQQRQQPRRAAEWPRQCTGAAATPKRSSGLRLGVKTEVISLNFAV